ncbi:Baeyer-Villiger monooxygenase [Lachnellula suecica]|uniref:Baeyer-Villiger monooxygenase n=1 Tax=Lachnellula suecica TaxID=602035 RepID=A0A8T9BVD3_9HELO|nr:Baeyer-Villiger monooxygenase [Lachnellula suecica]
MTHSKSTRASNSSASSWVTALSMENAERDASRDFYTEVLIVGGGFGGVYALYKFRQLGLNVKLVEAGSDFGGVWHWNRYPGARVDSEFPFYQLSIPEVYKTFDFRERFPSHTELRRYFDHARNVLDLDRDAVFNTIVQGVTWSNGKWTCRIKDGRIIACKYLVLCTGSSYKKHLPAFKGLDAFGGTLLHSAAFPEEGVDVKGKRVAVIGNGSTGVQIIQELAKQDCDLSAFIRTPIMALPMKQRAIPAQEQESLRSFYDALLKASKASKAGFPYNNQVKTFSDASDTEREAVFEELWARGGFAFFLSNYVEFVTDKTANECIYNFWAKKTRARVQNPVKRDIVAPLKQEHYFGVKRPSLEQDYYESIDKPNVTLVNLKANPIREITKDGIQTNEHHKFDIIILATGYDAMTGSLMDLRIRDREGRLLQELWSDGVETYLGLMITGMPNMFMVYSPQAPTALSNGPAIIESQVDWVISAISKMEADGIKTIEPQRLFAAKWRKDIQEMNAKTLYPLENSWYMGANIPGKVREQLMYLGGVDAYNAAIKDALVEWKGFDLTS